VKVFFLMLNLNFPEIKSYSAISAIASSLLHHDAENRLLLSPLQLVFSSSKPFLTLGCPCRLCCRGSRFLHLCSFRGSLSCTLPELEAWWEGDAVRAERLLACPSTASALSRRLLRGELLRWGTLRREASPEHDHRNTDWVGWEGTFKCHPAQPPAMGRDIFNQSRVLRAPSNLAWNGSRDGASPTNLGNLGQGFTTFLMKNLFLMSSLNLPPFSLKPSPLVLSQQALLRSLSPSFLQAPIKYWKAIITRPRSLLFSRLNSPSCPCSIPSWGR